MDMPGWMAAVERRFTDLERRLRSLIIPEVISVAGAGAWGSSASTATRSGRTVTLVVNVTTAAGGGANVPATATLPEGWRPGGANNLYGAVVDSGSGGLIQAYVVNTTGQVQFIFSRGAGTGTLGYFTYVARA